MNHIFQKAQKSQICENTIFYIFFGSIKVYALNGKEKPYKLSD